MMEVDRLTWRERDMVEQARLKVRRRKAIEIRNMKAKDRADLEEFLIGLLLTRWEMESSTPAVAMML